MPGPLILGGKTAQGWRPTTLYGKCSVAGRQPEAVKANPSPVLLAKASTGHR